MKTLTAAEREEGLREIEQTFAEFTARREREQAEHHALLLAHFEAGGLVREQFHGGADPSDWRVTPHHSPEWLAGHLTNRKFGFLAANELLPGETPDWMPPTPEGAHTLAELREILAARGVTHVETLGGPLPLASWTPYGSRKWFGTLREDGTVLDTPHRPAREGDPFILGVWSFLTLSVADFHPGDRVLLSAVRHERLRGRTGTVQRTVKSRKVVRVALDGTGAIYDANPGNLQRLAPEDERSAAPA